MSSGSSYGELVIGKQDSSQALVASGSRRAYEMVAGLDSSICLYPACVRGQARSFSERTQGTGVEVLLEALRSLAWQRT